MSTNPQWEEVNKETGLYEIKLEKWEDFSDYINKVMLNYTNYVYRGHGDSEWKLEPTLDRIIKDPTSYIREKHLDAFKYETRARRGTNPPSLKHENDWWALGQHHGLATPPLLDWTASPFVALFFAVKTAIEAKVEKLAVFALWQFGVQKINELINKDNDVELINTHKPTVKIVRPLSDENNRLVNQRGLFTRGPNNMDLEEWVGKYNKDNETMYLIKITMPAVDLENCLRYLNRMNINDSTLFPDLTGASNYCNLHLTMTGY